MYNIGLLSYKGVLRPCVRKKNNTGKKTRITKLAFYDDIVQK